MIDAGGTPRVMIVGCGAVAERGFLPALARMGVVPAVAVDANLARAEDVATRFGVGVATADYRTGLGRVDAAIIALPHALHAAVCTDLLDHGVHTLVEKPMALSSAECEAMVAASRASGAVLAVGLMRRFRFASRWVKAALASGALGRVESIDVREGFQYGWPVASDFFFRRDSAGGGVLIDTGSHTLDQLLWWLGEVAVVSYRDDSHGGVEADCELEVELAGGGHGLVELSRTRRLRNTAILRCSRGEIEVPLHGNALTARPRRLLAATHDGRSGVGLPAQDVADLFTAELGDWLGAIARRSSPEVDGAEGARAVALIEGCYSRRRPLVHRWVDGVAPRERTLAPPGSPPVPQGRVLVTGASGFIGGRLVERLGLGGGMPVTALLRSLAGAARIARFPVRLVQGSLEDADALDRAVAGCEVVFHCAHDFSAEAPNLAGAEALAGACLRHGVRRLVYLSSFSVYEPLASGEIVETSAWPACEQPYVLAKRRTETALLARVRTGGLPVVILQPTVVYGPFCKPWTITPARLMRTGRIVLPDGGEGLCNAVYVDDLVDAMLLAADARGATGERFLVSGAQPVTWREFYAAFERMLSVSGVATLPSAEIERLQLQGEDEVDLRAVSRDLRRVTRWRPARLAADLMRTAIGTARWERLKGFTPPPLHLPGGARLDMYRAKPWVRIDKARDGLAYAPSRDLALGMELTAEYVRWAGL